MPITPGTAGTNVTEGDPQTLSYTPDAGDNRIVLVFVSSREDSSSIVGVSSSAGGTWTEFANVSAFTGQTIYAGIWYSTDFANGAQTISVDYGAGGAMAQSTIAAVTITGVRVSNPWRAARTTTSGTGTSASMNVSSAVGDLVVDIISLAGAAGDSLAVGSNQNAFFALANGGDNLDSGASYEAGAATVAMQWSWTNSRPYLIAAGSLVPAEGGHLLLGKFAGKLLRF